jgi:hypothetical protein
MRSEVAVEGQPCCWNPSSSRSSTAARCPSCRVPSSNGLLPVRRSTPCSASRPNASTPGNCSSPPSSISSAWSSVASTPPSTPPTAPSVNASRSPLPRCTTSWPASKPTCPPSWFATRPGNFNPCSGSCTPRYPNPSPVTTCASLMATSWPEPNIASRKRVTMPPRRCPDRPWPSLSRVGCSSRTCSPVKTPIPKSVPCWTTSPPRCRSVTCGWQTATSACSASCYRSPPATASLSSANTPSSTGLAARLCVAKVVRKRARPWSSGSGLGTLTK